ncbi:MarR family winged helix-turn-helix transcriptional regulator [Pelomonas sp. KK5]|uniref:MarR family winged helix-turn-helix transcriptional regulator n=1 Tax=Pelomonas sp. KK5 TaxID=1855730 RepID=UPI00097CB86C|nr:MarR family winged helix-turn-helix transcriptional regulator [Pelomonas sp. KK5]
MTTRKRSATAEIAADARLDEDARAVRVLLQFRQVFNAVKTHFQHVETSVGLGGAQLWALGVIRDTPGIGTGGVAERMNIHQSTASNLLGVLVERGLVAAGRDDGDKRAVKWRLMPAGAQVLEASPGPFTGVLPQALHELDEHVLERMEEDLALLLKQLGAGRKGRKIPLARM